MRLIDADKLYEALEELRREPYCQHEDDNWFVGIIRAQECVKEQTTINTSPELKEIISEYDYLLDKAMSGAIFSSSDYEYMDALRNRANDIIDQITQRKIDRKGVYYE